LPQAQAASPGRWQAGTPIGKNTASMSAVHYKADAAQPGRPAHGSFSQKSPRTCLPQGSGMGMDVFLPMIMLGVQRMMPGNDGGRRGTAVSGLAFRAANSTL
jgi:hypothetical protein